MSIISCRSVFPVHVQLDVGVSDIVFVDYLNKKVFLSSGIESIDESFNDDVFAALRGKITHAPVDHLSQDIAVMVGGAVAQQIKIQKYKDKVTETTKTEVENAGSEST